MTDSQKLKSKITEANLTIAKLATMVNLSPTGLFNKIHNIREFRISEMLKISECLKLSNVDRDKIFFANQVELNSTD